MITGAASMDGGITVVSATDGQMPQIRKHLLLARQVGIKKIDRIGDSEMEMRELFSIYGFDGGGTPIVIGSAPPLFIRLMETVDSWLDVPPQVFSIAGHETVASGRVERGTIMKSRSSDMVLPPRPLSWALKCSTRSSIRVKPVTSEVSSLNRFKGVKRSLHLGTVNSVKKFVAAIHVLTKEEGGRSYVFSSGYKPRLYSRTTNVTCGVTWPGGTADAETKMIMFGDNVEMVLVEPRCSSGNRFPIHTEREWTDGQ
ncbi:translation elongation factor Tu [Tulasnella sp. 418]|nr:translation elongation factor Tu [Tulasnella sp. 418]